MCCHGGVGGPYRGICYSVSYNNVLFDNVSVGVGKYIKDSCEAVVKRYAR